jgi:hypothetical protein
MKRSHALALSGVALFLVSSTAALAQAVRPGQQCVPAVANASMYGNWHLRIVRGQEVCRCAILPQALRNQALNDADWMSDRASEITGSIGGFSPAPSTPKRF